MKKEMFTANYFRKIAYENKMKELQEIKSVIMNLQEYDCFTDDDFTFELINDGEMTVNIDEIGVNIGNDYCVDWMKENCFTTRESDKNITITGWKF